MRFRALAWTAVAIHLLLFLYGTVLRVGDTIAYALQGGSTAGVIGLATGSLIYNLSGIAVLFFAVVAIRDWDED